MLSDPECNLAAATLAGQLAASIDYSVMLGLGRPMRRKKSNTLTHVVRVRYRCCNYYFYMLHSGHCIKHDVLQWEFFMFKSDIRVVSIHIFFILQEMISDVATVIYYQCCTGLSDEKILIGHPRDSRADRT